MIRQPSALDSSYDIIVSRGPVSISQGDMNAAYRAMTEHPGPFGLVVLCAIELEEMFREIQKRRRPHLPNLCFASFKDGTLTRGQIETAARAADQVVRAYRRGLCVLVSCGAGRNRSGLVTALAVHKLSGIGGQAAADLVRRKRVGALALMNEEFNRFLNAIPPREASGVRRQATGRDEEEPIASSR
jgi:protein-tyrosine phosphatase